MYPGFHRIAVLILTALYTALHTLLHMELSIRIMYYIGSVFAAPFNGFCTNIFIRETRGV